MSTATTCTACGQPSNADFCYRPACLGYGSGAIAGGPSVRTAGAGEEVHSIATLPELLELVEADIARIRAGLEDEAEGEVRTGALQLVATAQTVAWMVATW